MYKNSGIALVAVLAILVVLAIMASAFTVMMDIENKQSSVQLESQRLDMLVDSGLEHAKSLLSYKTTKSKENNIVVYSEKNLNPKFSSWIDVKDNEGKIIGRYRIKIEDEAAKVNISKARLLDDGKGSSWDTGEVNLSRALGLPPKYAKKIVQYRYGPNRVPGGRNDDNFDNIVLMADGIDNDADGEVDEEDEGINDPSEYDPDYPKGDDRKLSTISEAMSIFLKSKNELSSKFQYNIVQKIPSRSTIYSIDKPGSPSLPNKIPADINSITPRECRKLLIAANSDTSFDLNANLQRQLAANLVDYRDENHVLSTIGSAYGVEAICFNEILANDESYTIPLDKADNLLLPDNYWKDSFGSEDSKRLIYRLDTFYQCVPDDPHPWGEFPAFYYNLDPRMAWRITKKANTQPMGDIKSAGNNFVLYFPKVIGKYNGSSPNINPFSKSNPPLDLPCPGVASANNYPWCKWAQRSDTVYSYAATTYRNFYKELINVLRNLNSVVDTRPKVPDDYFKHSLVNVYEWSDNTRSETAVIGCFKIIGSDADSITIDSKNVYDDSVDFNDNFYEAGFDLNNCDLSFSINAWGDRSQVASVGRANVTYLMRSRRPQAGNYYKVIIGRPPKGGFPGYPSRLGVSGIVGGEFTDDKNYSRQWLYNKGDPIVTKKNGWMKIMITSSPSVSRLDNIKQQLAYIRILTPEVVEMYNASATPISLANWRVICNTGSFATQIGKIKSTGYYDRKLRRSVVDDNPVVQPKGHFYLVNDTKLFDHWYGNGDSRWGSSVEEQIPVFQMDEQNWGITYKIKSTESIYAVGYSIKIDEKGLDQDTFIGETIKFVDKKHANSEDSWNNVFVPILYKDYFGNDYAHQANELITDVIGDPEDIASGKLVGKSVMVLGLLHNGGVVSLTLKNEYDQVCARTIDYGKVEIEEYNKSTEKSDPTKGVWFKRRENSIGGTDADAINQAMSSRRNIDFFIKNGPFGSIGEAKNISSGGDFERLGAGGDISKGANALGAFAKYMSSSHVRLESCIGDVERKGWAQAYNVVDSSSLRSVTTKNANWENDMWKGQTLRFLNGPLRGEKYPISSNTKNSLKLSETGSKYVPRSAPNKKSLKPDKGDKFSVGPGYNSPFCYTRKPNEEGEWIWKNAVHTPGTYNLYIYGLNDAIETTEFFEENNNSSIDVELWNYKYKKFDIIKKRGKFGKQDSFNAGKIRPENFSPDGDVRMKLVSHDVFEKNTEDKSGEVVDGVGGKQTGFAWFNYAVITPVPVLGRVNVNTAPPRLLASIPGINAKLAKNIFDGMDRNNKKTLKPYQSVGDLFKVPGMNPDIFERCVNLLTVDSDMFTVEVEAQTMGTTLKGEKFVADETVSKRMKRFVIELDKKPDGFIKITEKERCPVR